MKNNMGRRQNAKNILANIFAFLAQFIIFFYVSPIIVDKVGASAYGFIGLANDFVSYAAILATVFNSVAARFIANSVYKCDYETANNYFNSLIVTNFGIAGLIGILTTIFVPNIDRILSIPVEICGDVKITFGLTFIAYIITLVTMVFTTSTFVSNRTDIQGIRNILQYVIRFILVVVFINFVSVKIYWISLATLIANIIVAVLNVNLTRILTPELRINLKYAKKKYAYELGKSGSWMAFTSISVILLRGLDLTVANLLIGNYEMGLLSIARTMPNTITSVINTIAPIFTPVFLAHYANNSIIKVTQNVKDSIKIMAMILYVPISGFIVLAYDFYSLWQPSLSDNELTTITYLSLFTVAQTYFDASTSTMAQISVVVNKLKMPVIVSFGCGIVSILIEILLIKFTSMGLYAIALSSAVVMILRYVLFNSRYAAWCLKARHKEILVEAAKTWVAIPILLVIMYCIKMKFPIYNWKDFLVNVIICGGVGYSIMILLYGRDELKHLKI